MKKRHGKMRKCIAKQSGGNEGKRVALAMTGSVGEGIGRRGDEMVKRSIALAWICEVTA